MKLTKKSIISKIAMLCISLVLLNFFCSMPVYADDGLGGKLLQPVTDLVIAIGDGIVNLIHSTVKNESDTIMRIDTSSRSVEINCFYIGRSFGCCIIGCYNNCYIPELEHGWLDY